MKKYTWNELNEIEQKNILLRPASSKNENTCRIVQDILDKVKASGDKCVIELTEKYDNVKLSQLRLTEAELGGVFTKIAASAKKAIEFAKERIEMIHQAQLPNTQVVTSGNEIYYERQARPIERVGLYIPGGSAPLVSTVLMLAIPAQIANCSLRILCTPPNRDGEIDPHILFAAQLCGIQSVYKIGGAQAIAAMAYGTQTIPKVDKIFGPGNAWVTQAKMLVSQDPNGVSIDMPAGPSEVMVIADADANPEYVAADLLAQAEHGIDSHVMLVTTSENLLLNVAEEIKLQLNSLPRRQIIEKALENSRMILVENLQQAITVSNCYAPEHLILQVKDAQQYIPFIQHAGAVFLGPWSAETLGDYVIGSNHVLPTYGYARSYSGLSVADFMKFISFQYVTASGLRNIGPYAEKLAEIEGLQAHKLAVSRRSNERVPCDEQYQ